MARNEGGKMRLKNKRTGEIGELQITEKHCAVSVGNGTASCGIEIYSSLNGLNEEWEDAPEEPKTHWNITSLGDVIDGIDKCSSQTIDEVKQIGNYFDTREEAELAIRKLKAWKRLKDKGFRFKRWECTGEIEFTFDNYVDKGERTESAVDDLNLLFGGEE